jgi:signal transduction histidine kinase
MDREIRDTATTQAATALLRDLAGLVDPDVLGNRAAATLRTQAELPLVSFALPDRPEHFTMSCGDGVRTGDFYRIRLTPGQGLGGRALQGCCTCAVEDYGTDPRISDHFRGVVVREGLRGAVAVPVLHDDRTIAILYGARREWGRPQDRAIVALESATPVLAPLLATAMAAQQQTTLRVGQERQRLAGALHDDVGQLLFAINAAARRATELKQSMRPHLQLDAAIAHVEDLAALAATRLREALADLTPTTPMDRLPVAAQRDLDDFSERSGVLAYLLVPQDARAVPPEVETAVLSCLRQALFNVERHADASLVIVTLDFAPDSLSLVVQDDGQGVPDGFTARAVPDDGHYWGSASMLRQIEQLGGRVRLGPGEEGGLQLHVWLPLDAVHPNTGKTKPDSDSVSRS